MTAEEAEEKADKINAAWRKGCAFLSQACTNDCMAFIHARTTIITPSEPISNNCWGVTKPSCKRLK